MSNMMHDDIDMPAYLMHIKETMIVTQLNLSKKIGTSQQNCSKWMDGTRRMSPKFHSIILALGDECGLDIDNFRITKTKTKIQRMTLNQIQRYRNQPLEMRRIMDNMLDMSNHKRKRVLGELSDWIDLMVLKGNDK